MLNKSYTIGRAFGIPIKVHGSLILVVLFFALQPNVSPLDIIALALGLFGSVALHELGHSLVARRKGCYVHEIILSPLGGAAKMMNIPSRPRDEIQVALAGPAVSLVLAVLCALVPSEIFAYFASINTMLFLFNILPVFPMDGGRVLRAALSIKRGRLTGTRIAVEVSKYFCFAFAIIGILNWSYFMLILIAVFIYRAGKMEYAMVQQEYRADPWRGQSEGRIDVEVSPPPYLEKSWWKFKWPR